MNSPASLAAAFKIKAAALKQVVTPHLAPPALLGMVLLDAMTPEGMAAGFHEHVADQYDDRIRDRDTAFFMEHDVGGGDPVVAALRSSWLTMSDAERAQAWVLLRQLCSISKRYASVVA